MGRGWSILIGIACLAGAVYTADQALEFHRHGEVVTGKVLSVDARLSTDESGIDYSERQLVQYTPTGSNRPLTMKTHWSSGWFFTRKPGDSVAIRYLPTSPEKAREDSRLFDWLAPIALVLLAIGGFTGRLTWSEPERVWWRRGSDD